jgi:hypothetical protein
MGPYGVATSLAELEAQSLAAGRSDGAYARAVGLGDVPATIDAPSSEGASNWDRLYAAMEPGRSRKRKGA